MSLLAEMAQVVGSGALRWCAPCRCGFGYVWTAGTPSLLDVIVCHRRDGVPAVRNGNPDRMRHRWDDFFVGGDGAGRGFWRTATDTVAAPMVCTVSLRIRICADGGDAVPPGCERLSLEGRRPRRPLWL
jgi:hypothetical protein